MSEASKIQINEAPPRLQAPPALRTAVCCLSVVTQRGPVGLGPILLCPEDYKKYYGRYIPQSEGPQAVEEFFTGGRYLYLNRVVHYTDITNPASATAAKASVMLQTVGGGSSKGRVTASKTAPYKLTNNSTLQIATELDPTGTEVLFKPGKAELEDTTTYPVADQDGKTDIFKVNGDEFTVTYPAGTTTAALVCVAINLQVEGVSVDYSSGQVRIITDRRGTGATLEHTGGDSDLTWPSGEVAGTGFCADLSAVTCAELKAKIESEIVTCGGTTTLYIERSEAGGTKYVEVLAASTADTLIGLDNAQHAGTTDAPQDTIEMESKDPWNATSITTIVADASNEIAADFDFYVLESGVVSETWRNLSMDPASDRYLEAILNDDTYGSDLVRLTDQLLAGTKRPANGTSAGLAGGNDGLSGLVDADYVGSQAGGTGFHAFDTVPDKTLLAVPGISTAAVVSGQILYELYCAARGQKLFSVYDLPDDCTFREAVAAMATLGLTEATEYGATYWPARGLIMNPATDVFGSGKTIEIPTSASVLAAMARGDAKKPGGIYEQPAGIDWGDLPSWVGCQQQADTDNPDVLDYLATVRINGVTRQGHGRFYANDGFCLKSTGNWPDIHQRRGVSFIEQTVRVGMLPYKNRNNTEQLRSTVFRFIRHFLEGQFDLGAFDGDTYDEAFWVDVGTGLNTPTVRRAKQLKARVGLSMVNSAAQIIIEFTADERGVESKIITYEG